MLELNLDPSFSVYRLLERIQRSSSIINHRRTMTIISHEIENATLDDGVRPMVFSSFQYLSRFLPQQARYERLAQQAQHVYVFGVPDVDLPVLPNITYVALRPNDQLAREWFILSADENYASVLATEELSQFSDPDELRHFKGIWTFDRRMASILQDWLCDIIGMRHDDRPPLPDRPAELGVLQRALMHSAQRLERRLQVGKDDLTTQNEVRQLLQRNLAQAMQVYGVSV